MAKIVINEISDNYTYNIGTSSYATIALPITAAWGPAYMDPKSVYGDDGSGDNGIDMMLEEVGWTKFPATQAGLESFVSTYRGPESNYKIANDYSYQMAMTLLTSGYDVLVCRVCPGAIASGGFNINSGSGAVTFGINAKYPGTFGNNLRCALTRYQSASLTYWSLITYIEDSVSGTRTAVENLAFVFDEDDATENVPYIGEVESAYLTFIINGIIKDSMSDGTSPTVEPINPPKTGTDLITSLVGGTDSLTLPTQLYGTTKDDESGVGGDVHKGTASDVLTASYFATVNVEPSDWDTPAVKQEYYVVDTTTETEGVTVWTFKHVTTEDFTQGAIFQVFETYEAIALANGQTASNTAVLNNLADVAKSLVQIRYGGTNGTTVTDSVPTPGGYWKGIINADATSAAYYSAWTNCSVSDPVKRAALAHNEWVYNSAFLVYQLLIDKLNYNPQRIMSPGWDDQNINTICGKMFGETGEYPLNLVSPLHQIIMNVAYRGRCATGLIDIPKSCPRGLVYTTASNTPGYAQLLSRIEPFNGGNDVNQILYSSHSTLFAPWGQYRYVGTSKMRTASPSFLAMLIQRAQILNQPAQYEWALPTNRKHNLNIGKMDYAVPKKLLDVWQTLEGVGVNVITKIPDLGTNLWGNSTLFEVPPATYQALANLSTRYLVNAVENVAYKCGLNITFQYNNEQAYGNFYSGVTPILDTMKNVGAIEDYYVKMAADINGLDQVNANSVIGKVYLVINGVINDITIDLIALPPGTDLSQFAS